MCGGADHLGRPLPLLLLRVGLSFCLPPQGYGPPSAQAEDPKGLLWILDEEALIQGASDSTALDRLCASFAREGVSGKEGKWGGLQWG